MANVDDKVRSGLRRLASPADPDGVVELVLRRAARHRTVRRLTSVAVAIAVVAVTIAGTYVLVKVFPRSEHRAPGTSFSPLPLVPHANGLIAYAESFPEGVRLKTTTPEGSDQQVVPTPSGLAWLPAWSPDGTELAVAIFPNGNGDRAIWVMHADGSDPHRVASADNVSRPSWSPDGSSIAYSAQSGDTSSIHVVGKDGSGDRVLYTTQARGTHAVFSATFSPDGTEILFDQGTESGFDIFVMNVDGSNVRRVTITGHDYDPHWSPDGTRIAFTRQEGPMQSDIFVMDADGSHVLRLTDGGPGETNLFPEWSPDGSKIAYLAGKTGGPGGLVVMNVDGSDPVTLVPDGVLGISWQPLAVTGSPTPPGRPGGG